MVGHVFFAGRTAVYKTIILTSTGANTWTVPSDWNDSDNSIECIGAGQAGGNTGSNLGGNGGSGGDYAKISNLSLTPGASVDYSIGPLSTYAGSNKSADAAADTFFNGATFGAASVAAAGGGSSNTSSGDVVFTGGPGGSGRSYGTGGGGGSGGPLGFGGAGGSGRNASGAFEGGGGGGASGGSNGEDRNAYNLVLNGDGGNNVEGTGGGVNGGPNGIQPVTPSNGGGGAGGSSVGNFKYGQDGTTYVIWTQTSDGFQAGSGAGGGGKTGALEVAGRGANYGGGGGGQYGIGAQGLIVIRYLGSA